MKKVTIITFPEYEPLVLSSLGKASVTQLKPVTGAEYEDLKAKDKTAVDFKALFKEIDIKYGELRSLTKEKLNGDMPDADSLREYVRDPKGQSSVALKTIDRLIKRLADARMADSNAIDARTHAIKEKRASIEALHREKADSLRLEYKTRRERIELFTLLEGENLTGVLAVGIIQSDILDHFKTHAQKHDVEIAASKVSDHESLIIVKGASEKKAWIDSLFLVFEVRSVPYTDSDPVKRRETLTEEKRDFDVFTANILGTGSFEERLKIADDAHRKEVEGLDAQIQAETSKGGTPNGSDAAILLSERKSLGGIQYVYKMLKLASNDRVQVKRTSYYSIMQGWTPDNKLEALKKAVSQVSEETGGRVILEIEDPGKNDVGVPMQSPRLFGFLQPTWRLTTLRGWPSPTEVNPKYISLFIFCLQFGFMFGDIGQGLVFLLVGVGLLRLNKKGLIKKVGTLFIPMGIAAIIFGFLYGSFFLIEIAYPPGAVHHAAEAVVEAAEGASHAAKESGMIKLDLYQAILPNPLENTMDLLMLILKLGVAEILFGVGLSVINNWNAKNYAALIGEKGAGMACYIWAIYTSIGPGFTINVNTIPLNLVGIGLLLSFIEPTVHAALSGHGIKPMEVISQGIGGLMMTFVEGLANTFSFLRIAAFALAHASLAVAAGALSGSVPVVAAYIIMNFIAMSFELISSSVQSMRLLYYEFMGKFYDGKGSPFIPYVYTNGEKEA